MHLRSLKQIWDYLRDEFFKSERTRQIQAFNLTQKFETLRMKDSENIRDFTSKMIRLVNQLRLLGREITEERLVTKMLVSLPEKYEAKVSSLEEARYLTQITLKELVNALEGLEQRKAIRQKSAADFALIAKSKTQKDDDRKLKSDTAEKKNGRKKTGEKRQ